MSFMFLEYLKYFLPLNLLLKVFIKLTLTVIVPDYYLEHIFVF